MKAMVFAAGLGTRLQPLTNDRPKALVEIEGRTLLEITLCRLRRFGVNEVIVNVHHFADQVVEYLRSKNNFGMRLEISREEDMLLDTGGGLKKAAPFFGEDSRDEPFLVHNVDVLSNIDLGQMPAFHREHGALASLAVQKRESSRQLLFDTQLRLCGRRRKGEPDEIAISCDQSRALAFCGIHVISPRIFGLMTEQGVFSIIDVYLRLARAGEKIVAFPADPYYWRDVGKPEQVEQAAKDIRSGILTA